MSSQRPSENSVLFSLRELRRIEDDRVKKEQETVRAKAEAERQAKEAAEQATREAEARRVHEEQDRIRREHEEHEHGDGIVVGRALARECFPRARADYRRL